MDERLTAFALILADAVIFNILQDDIARRNRGGLRTLEFAFKAALRQRVNYFAPDLSRIHDRLPRKTLLVFAIRDTRPNLRVEVIRKNLLSRVQDIWNAATATVYGLQQPIGTYNNLFDIEIQVFPYMVRYSLASPRHAQTHHIQYQDQNAFTESARKFGRRFTDPACDDYLLSEKNNYSRRVCMNRFPRRIELIWVSNFDS
jgi:hypothetical protein